MEENDFGDGRLVKKVNMDEIFMKFSTWQIVLGTISLYFMNGTRRHKSFSKLVIFIRPYPGSFWIK